MLNPPEPLIPRIKEYLQAKSFPRVTLVRLPSLLPYL